MNVVLANILFILRVLIKLYSATCRMFNKTKHMLHYYQKVIIMYKSKFMLQAKWLIIPVLRKYDIFISSTCFFNNPEDHTRTQSIHLARTILVLSILYHQGSPAYRDVNGSEEYSLFGGKISSGINELFNI